MSEGRPGKVISSPMMILSIADVSRCILCVELVSWIEFWSQSDKIREISDEMRVVNDEKWEFSEFHDLKGCNRKSSDFDGFEDFVCNLLAFVIVAIVSGDPFEEACAEYQPRTLRFDRFRPGWWFSCVVSLCVVCACARVCNVPVGFCLCRFAWFIFCVGAVSTSPPCGNYG